MIGIHWIALYLYKHSKNATHFDSFAAEQIPEEIKKSIRNKTITKYIHRIQQAYDSRMCGYFWIWFIDLFFIIKGCQINDDAGGVHNNSQLKSKTTIFAVKFAVSDAYILMEGNITVVG